MSNSRRHTSLTPESVMRLAAALADALGLLNSAIHPERAALAFSSHDPLAQALRALSRDCADYDTAINVLERAFEESERLASTLRTAVRPANSAVPNTSSPERRRAGQPATNDTFEVLTDVTARLQSLHVDFRSRLNSSW